MGFVYAVINAFMLAVMSMFAKLLSSYFGPIEVTFLRNGFAFLSLFVFLIIFGKFNLLKTQRPRAHIFRSMIGTAGVVLMMQTVALLPLVQATVLIFTAPFFVVLLSYPVLKEPVGLYRIGAVVVGFTGVIIAVNPYETAGNLPVLGIVSGLGCGFFAGSVDLCLRWMGKTEDSVATVFYFLLFSAVITGLHWPFAVIKLGSFMPDIFWMIVGIGSTVLLMLLAKTQSFRLAEASLIAPVMYTMIVWAMLFDYLFWDRVPGTHVVIGAIVIISSNLFILYRENVVRKSVQ